MLRSFIEHVVMVVIAAIIAIWFTNAFDIWYQQCEENRAHRRQRRARKHHRHNRYE